MALNHVQERAIYGGAALLLYGQYFMLYCASLYVLGFHRRTTSLLNKRLLIVNSCLFILGTSQAITFWLFPILIVAPSVKEMTNREANIENVLFTITTMQTTVASFIADSLLIWRCYIIWAWGRAIWVVMTRKHYSSLAVLSVLLTDVNVIFFAMSFATNILITGLIGTKIWWDTRDSRRLLGEHHGQGLRRAMLIIIESGVIYSLGLLLSVIFNTVPNLGSVLPQNLLAAVMSQIVGIFPTAITVLVGLGATAEKTMTAGDMPSLGHMSFVRPARQGDLETQSSQSEQLDVRRISMSAANTYSTNEKKIDT
ncbi:hypothetical protein NEOLEDRAFT_755110 [Neolentinus lepideus HHB14362 ss-1]|uniref:Uncharacterized protein n=1 Tax=Neolentinus lepideus HHB14362 ss-1 TaxID=1314782 RepID=A0A165PQP4_9AGAM|nr:hypothetical protein NEOLEDRAFT_755110 [Neolentinus lepideus HHB14362 ss-1]